MDDRLPNAAAAQCPKCGGKLNRSVRGRILKSCDGCRRAAKNPGPSAKIELRHRGAYNELIAVAWLLTEGYEVFRNVSSHGCADLVVWRGEDVRFVDVKASTRTQNGEWQVPKRKSEARRRGVWLLLVSWNGEFRWVHPQEESTRDRRFGPRADRRMEQCSEPAN
jgi:Holliday junction resolvase-like predicted endonuclease